MKKLHSYIIDHNEAAVIKTVLDYAYHRVIKHDQKHLTKYFPAIQKLRQDFD